MSGWAWATHVAIGVLITGSVGVFAWFLLEVLRIAARGPADRHSSSSRSSSKD
jgi:hypothetical protein